MDDDASLSGFSTSSTLVPSSSISSSVTLKDTNTSPYAPAPTQNPSTVLSFSTGSINNTAVLSSSNVPLYTISTDALTNSHTQILRGNSEGGELVAEIKRRDLLPDVVKFASWPSKKKLKNWIHGAGGKANDFPISFEWNSLTYTWKTNEGLQIALYNDLRPSMPIAWFQSAARSGRGADRVRDLLALQPEAESMLDAVLVSFVVVEQSLRWKDTLYHSARFIPLPFVDENQTTSY